jgi:hypothetical protein
MRACLAAAASFALSNATASATDSFALSAGARRTWRFAAASLALSNRIASRTAAASDFVYAATTAPLHIE